MHSEYPVLITLGALLVLNPLVKGLLERIGIPALIGYILLGVGVSAFTELWLFSTPLYENTFEILAHIGIVALLFRVGLKSNIKTLMAKLPDASLIWLGDVITNVALGFFVAYYALDLPLLTSLVIATAFSATSVAVSVTVWQEMGKLNTGKGQLLVDVAELDDLSGVLLLAILLAVIPAMMGSGGPLLPLVGVTAFLVILKLLAFITGCYLFAHYIEPGFTRFNLQIEGSTTGLSITVLGAGLAIAAVAGYLGFSIAIGALFAGLAFSRDPQAVRTDAKFAHFYELFTPFFFVHIGMQVHTSAILPSFELGAILFIAAGLGKFVGVAVPALLTLTKSDAVLLGISMIPRAEIALVIMYQCRQFGEDVVPDNIFAAMVLVAAATALVAPFTLRYLLAKR